MMRSMIWSDDQSLQKTTPFTRLGTENPHTGKETAMEKIVLKLELIRKGQRPGKAKIELTDIEPMPNQEHAALVGVKPLSIFFAGENFYPTFQRDKRTNVLYKNIANCVMCFRETGTKSDWDILLWFIQPNESLDGETPMEMGRHQDKEARDRIVEAAELDQPLNANKNTW